MERVRGFAPSYLSEVNFLLIIRVCVCRMDGVTFSFIFLNEKKYEYLICGDNANALLMIYS